MTRREALKASPLNYARRTDEQGVWFATEQRMYLQVDGTLKPCTWPAHTADLQTWEPVLPTEEISGAASESAPATPAGTPVPSTEPVIPQPQPAKEHYAKQPAKQAKLKKRR